MRRLMSWWLMVSASAVAQVTLTANVPQYNFQVLAGSQRQVSVKLTGGTTKRVNWSVLSTTGGASATLDRGANAPGVVNVTIGPNAGSCAIDGTPSHYTVTSPASVTVQAQSVDDPSKTAKFLFNVCANTTSVDVLPAYQQAYRGQSVEIQTWVTGNTNEAGTWAIVSQPAGGDAKLPDTTKRDALFTATVTGRYTLRYTSAADPTKSADAIVYVSPNAMPSYSATTSLTQPTECYPDPQLTGKVYEVGPGLAYTTVRSVPVNSWPAGSIMRVHNVDTTGANPTTYHEATRIMGTGTPSQPLIMCGVPDSKGNLPVIDGDRAVSPGWANGYTQIFGIVSIWGQGSYLGKFKDGSAGPDYAIVSGLAIQHAGTKYNVISLDDGTAKPYTDGASCVNVRSGTHLLIEGNDMNLCSNGLFVANNSQNNGFSQVTRYVDIRGNRLRNSSSPGSFSTHDAYVQSWYSLIENNRFESLVAGADGDTLKDRGIESIIRYNLFQAAVANQLINFQSETDSENYVAFEPFLGTEGATPCNGWYCGGDTTVSADQLTAWQEGLEKDFVYGNIFSGRTYQLADINYGDVGGQNAPFNNATEMADHQGRLYFYYNTEDQPGYAVFATLSGTNNGGDPEQQFMKPTVIATNNILYKTKQNPNIFAFARNASVVGAWQTNLMNQGTFSIATPIMGQPSNGNGINGWDSYTDQFQYPLDAPIDAHQTGLTTANFLQTPAVNQQPYNPATFAPTATGGAVGAASAITDAWASLLPVRLQYSVDKAAVVLRTSTSTIGAVETGSQPALVSITASPTTVALLSTLTTPYYSPIPVPLNCLYANGLTTDCGPSVTLTPSNALLSVSSGSRILPIGTGYGTVTASLNGVTSAAMSFSVNGAASPAPSAPTVVQVVLSPLTVSLSAGGTQQLAATATYSDASIKTCTPASWTSVTPSVATVSSSGLVTGIGGGASAVTAVCGGTTSVPATIAVLGGVPTPPPTVPPPTPPSTPTPPTAPTPTVTSVTLSPASVHVLTGSTQQLVATATYSDASTKSCTPANWTSSAPAVAAVSNAGVVSGAAAGSSSVTAMCSGVTSTPAAVTVSATKVKAWMMRPLSTP